jgi:hypothetical protein
MITGLEGLLFQEWVKKTEGLVREILDIPTPQERIERKLDQILGTQKVILEAPFEVAMMHFNDGRIEKGMDKIKDAISKNELDLRSRLFYIHLLALEKQYDRVHDELWKLLDIYGFAERLIPLIPLDLLEEYVNDYTNSKINLEPFQRRIREYYLEEIWCSLGGIVTKWKQYLWERPIWEPPLPKKVIKAFSWGGKDRFEVEKKEIKLVTNKYAILGGSIGSYDIYRLSDGFHLPLELSSETFAALFSQSEKYKYLIESAYTNSNEFTFRSVTIKGEKYTSTTSPVIDERGGILNVSFCESLDEE